MPEKATADQPVEPAPPAVVPAEEPKEEKRTEAAPAEAAPVVPAAYKVLPWPSAEFLLQRRAQIYRERSVGYVGHPTPDAEAAAPGPSSASQPTDG